MDKDFTVRKKADRQIHYAGQGKKYTENTANFSPKEKQNVLRQKNLPGAGTGIQAQIQRQSNAGRDAGDFFADDTAKSYQQEHGNNSGNRSRDYSALGNLPAKRMLQGYQKEDAAYRETSTGSEKSEQQQDQGQRIQRPSAYHENTIKTKEPVLHRKSNISCNIKRADGFSLKERKGKKVKAQGSGHLGTGRAEKNEYAKESRRAEASGNLSTIKSGERFPDSGYAQPFFNRRDGQISSYKRKKFFRSGKEKYSRKCNRENTGRKADTVKSAGTPEMPEAYRLEVQPLQVQGMGESALLQRQNNLRLLA